MVFGGCRARADRSGISRGVFSKSQVFPNVREVWKCVGGV